MRILVVSAHYPPNFVSGGTLAPQRQARGLRTLGHEVSVYAGWLGTERAPLSTWTDEDEEGMAVRWVTTTPWVGWADGSNFDNVQVADDFAGHLRAVRPDVVHFHSLQSLGGRLVSVAGEAGAKVVVTMHDFWWLCGRQFLVDRSDRPCPIVVSCGECPCEVDRPWLESRTATLAPHLARADAVLAVSRIQADVLTANGISLERLRVDENAVPEPAGSVATGGSAGSGGRAPTGDLRFTYAGGPHRMKGVHVLLDAARRLEERQGWHLTGYGIGPFIDDEAWDISGLPIEAVPPFDPAHIEAVFSSSDVLIVPSVMRETYSLITREALTRGVPVICTDSLGPEEVVEDGVNGIVVPAGDAAALASAVERLLVEDGLLAKLRAGCSAVPVRSVASQVSGLDRLYRELLPSSRHGEALAGASGAAGRRHKVRRVLFLAGIQGAPLRYRAQLPAEALRLLGVHVEVRHYRDPEVPFLAAGADAVVVYRVPATPQITDLIASVRRRGVPVFFDVDDLIFDPDLGAEIPALAILEQAEADHWLEGVQRYRTTMELCDAFIGSTDALCRHAEEVVGLPAARFANGVGIVLSRASQLETARPRSPGPSRIGYLSGTNTHDHDWRMIEPAIVDLLAERHDIELWLGGPLQASRALEPFLDRVRCLPFLPWLEVPGVLRDLDVNLAPLEGGSRFNEAKSAIKWLEAALTLTPTVASPTEAFRDAVDHGRTGLLAETCEEWGSALRSLLDDGVLRDRLARNAQRDALLRWSPHLQGPRYLEILETDWSGRRRQRPAGGWQPLSHDEPFAPFDLEPYPPEPPEPRNSGDGAGDAHSAVIVRRLRRMRSLSAVGVRSMQHDGVVATVERTVRLSGRRWPTVENRVKRAVGKARDGMSTVTGLHRR